jgi:hypothetical protein
MHEKARVMSSVVDGVDELGAMTVKEFGRVTASALQKFTRR